MNNIRELAKEILAWHNTGILPGEHLRTMASELRNKSYGAFSIGEALSMAEHQVKMRALKLIIQEPPVLREEPHTPGAALIEENKVLKEALKDLLSWFPDEPSDPEWRIRGGENGADEAIDHARGILAAMKL